MIFMKIVITNSHEKLPKCHLCFSVEFRLFRFHHLQFFNPDSVGVKQKILEPTMFIILNPKRQVYSATNQYFPQIVAFRFTCVRSFSKMLKLEKILHWWKIRSWIFCELKKTLSLSVFEISIINVFNRIIFLSINPVVSSSGLFYYPKSSILTLSKPITPNNFSNCAWKVTSQFHTPVTSTHQFHTRAPPFQLPK